MKKGAIEIQFNWIFILIAGGLILALVIGFVSNLLENSNKQDIIKTLGTLETIITATGVVEGESKVVPSPNLVLDYECGELRLDGAAASGTKATFIFAPSLIKGNYLLIWTSSWFVPFYAGNLVYVTTLQTKYNIYYDPSLLDLKEELEDLFPDKLNVEFRTDDNFEDETSPVTIFVYLGTTGDQKNWKGEQFGIEISANVDNRSGGLRFLEKGKTAWTFAHADEWIKTEALAGAIISGNGQIYKCVKEAALERVEIMSAVLLKKIDLIEGADPDKYATAKGILEGMHTAAVGKNLRISDIEDLAWENTILSYEIVPQIY